MEDYQPELGEIVRELRAEGGLGSQDDLAHKAGIGVRAVRNIETGKVAQENSLALVCQALGTSSSEVKKKALERRKLNSSTQTEISGNGSLKNYGTFSDTIDRLDNIDSLVTKNYGVLISPTREDDNIFFSSRRLISSLSSIGITLDVAFIIIEHLPKSLGDILSDSTNFSTNHVRMAVSKSIASLRPDEILRTDVFQKHLGISKSSEKEMTATVREMISGWAKRYARRYGNPSQITQILQENGEAVRLDYNFLKTELIPHVLRRVLGNDFSISSSTIVNKSIVSDMSRSTLEEFRRLGLYTIRYRTALWLAEDLAVHPPHPWIVSENTRDETIKYDLDRANANIKGLEGGSSTNHLD